MPESENNRLVIRFAGESGQGINTLGEITSRALKNSNFYTFAYREYPSLIKGGVASYQIDISSSPLSSSSRYSDILISLDTDALIYYLKTAKNDSIVIYDDKEVEINKDIQSLFKQKNINYKYIPTKELALQVGGKEIMSNMVLLGVLWNILNIEIRYLEDLIKQTFKNKNVDIKAEIKCVQIGNTKEWGLNLKDKLLPAHTDLSNNYIISGNEAIALGLISGGLRAYFAYPMTPASSILKYLGDTYKDTGVIVKQAESEITAAQMVLGSMHAGTRAATATSGGGFDLMTETICCAGMTETPFFVILAQRTGPGTGVPTWTGAGDLRDAIYCGHGEYPKCVVSVSDVQSSYIIAQEALNIADEYQIPVILLTEKQIAESLYNVKNIWEEIEINRGDISNDTIPYKITENGVSSRLIPSQIKSPFLKNSDEHTENGISTEDPYEVKMMSDKRAKKMETLKQRIPEPKIYGRTDSETLLIGWGSVKNTVLDAIKQYNLDISYLHYEYIYPIKTEFFKQLTKQKKRIILVENNQSGQLGEVISADTGYIFKEKLLKYDGRPFFVEDILEFLKNDRSKAI